MREITDEYIARRYISKLANARKANIEFTLPLMSFSNILKTKKCQYTGILLTLPRANAPIRGTDLTLERVDNSKGYIKGNVVAVCHEANNIKSLVENTDSVLSVNDLIKMFTKINNLIK